MKREIAARPAEGRLRVNDDLPPGGAFDEGPYAELDKIVERDDAVEHRLRQVAVRDDLERPGPTRARGLLGWRIERRQCGRVGTSRATTRRSASGRTTRRPTLH